MSLKLVKNLDMIGRGVNKRWIYKDDLQRELAHDYLQKINYSVQDINDLLEPSGRLEKRTDIVSLIVMVDWIADSVYQYKKCLLKKVMDSFAYSQQFQVERSYRYLKAIRSFIVAHPLDTSKHETLGLDGNVVCVDLRVSQPFLFNARESRAQRFGIDGIKVYDRAHTDDIYLYVYSKDSGAQFFDFLIVDLADVLAVACVYIDLLHALDAYLSKLRKKDYVAA